ncbi:metalloregulator ArsR/SmtB family transcription factor [Paenibacillus sp. UMB7766-LJ446]|jgi:ArsR family transcriptional regulator|nr:MULTISPECIES: metalloregulator ArsR/SmtB family transcription factor [Paenibacillus]MDK8190961.1 metalloregulator ArsR/SmtB family transcription factor [Paenibacillus sp. UMB7766-LJ446]MDN4605211.1 metalloregulator ArsR/SmtB family transcription factor [Paenibacillus vandeheii]
MDFIQDAADKLKLLGDKTRLTMLSLLKDREWCVCEFVDILDMSQPGISQHLRKLKDQGLVKESKRGQWVYYSLNVEDTPYIKLVLECMPDTAAILKSLNKEGVSSKCN